MTRRPIGAEAPAARLSGLDGRSMERRFLARSRVSLLAQIGAAPTPSQCALVEQAGHLALRLHLMDLRFLASGIQSDHDSRTYLAWANSYIRALRTLGLMGKAAAKRPENPARALAAYKAKLARTP